MVLSIQPTRTARRQRPAYLVAQDRARTRFVHGTTDRKQLVSEMLRRFSDVSRVYVKKSWPNNGARECRIIVNKKFVVELFGKKALVILPEPPGNSFNTEFFPHEKAVWLENVRNCLGRLLEDLTGEESYHRNRFWSPDRFEN